MAELEYEVKDGIGYLTMNRPEKMNAITPEMRRLLWDALQDVRMNPAVRVAILTGRGRAFSAGHDLAAMAAGRGHEWPTTDDVYLFLRHIWKPTIAAINGVCLAQGAGLALSCDIRIASTEARFGWPQVRRGISSVSGPAYLAHMVPQNVAFELLFTGEFMSAERALELNLVNRVVPPEQMMPAAEEMARKMLEGAPLSQAAIKEVAVRGSFMDLERRVVFARLKADLVLASEDAKEGLRAFAEKRKPVWQGR